MERNEICQKQDEGSEGRLFLLRGVQEVTEWKECSDQLGKMIVMKLLNGILTTNPVFKIA